MILIVPTPSAGTAVTAVHQAALLPILPCLIGLPVAAFGLGVVLPLWLVSLTLTGIAWCIVALLDVVLRAAGSDALAGPRAAIERAMHALTHPRLPDRFRKE